MGSELRFQEFRKTLGLCGSEVFESGQLPCRDVYAQGLFNGLDRIEAAQKSLTRTPANGSVMNFKTTYLRFLGGSFLAARTGRVVPTAFGRSIAVAVGEDLGLREQGKDHGLLAESENGLGLRKVTICLMRLKSYTDCRSPRSIHNSNFSYRPIVPGVLGHAELTTGAFGVAAVAVRQTMINIGNPRSNIILSQERSLSRTAQPWYGCFQGARYSRLSRALACAWLVICSVWSSQAILAPTS